MRTYCLILLLQVSFTLASAQQYKNNYDDFKKQAETLYKQKEYRSSALKYSEAFASIGDKGTIICNPYIGTNDGKKSLPW